ncbi:hypothetical protein C0J52_05596 [Blattella germanica]|nr:hypothetical protein C0J52_05596 [Blattella germanica]
MKTKKMANAALLICCTLTLYIGGLDAAAVITCEKDHECPRGTFCYEQGSTCATCINCSTYNRKDQKNRSCHKEPKDCGDCLSGFKEEYYVEGHRSNTCKKDESSQNYDFSWIYIVLGIFLPLLFAGIYALVVCRRRINKGIHFDYEIPPSYHIPATAPPSYESEPFLPDFTRGDECNRPSVPMETLETIELHVLNKKEESNMQKATVFRKCIYDSENQYDGEAQEDVPDGVETQEDAPDGVQTHADSDPIQQDEETLESTWTPYQNSEVATEANSEVPDQDVEQDGQTASRSTETISPGDLDTGGHNNDSGISSSGTSSASLHRHFSCFANSSDDTTIQDEATGITRSVSVEAVTPAKRQRRDSGTHSLGQASTSDTQLSDSDLHN